jgi:hypothetical protein
MTREEARLRAIEAVDKFFRDEITREAMLEAVTKLAEIKPAHRR